MGREPGLAKSGHVATRLERVAVILLNYGAENDTVDCIGSLLASDYPTLHIVLVDNASPDGSGERLRKAFADITYIQTGANLGYAGGNNTGIARALDDGCDYVLVLNNDTTVDPRCVSALVEAARRSPDVGAVGGKILFQGAPDRIWFGGGKFSRMRALGLHQHQGKRDADLREEAARQVNFLTGCCLLIPAPVLREVGGFEQDFFMYVEDLELSLRLREAGYRLVYEPAARIFHRVPLDSRPVAPYQIVLRDRNRRRLVRRRYDELDRLRFALFFYPSRVARAVQYLARRDLERARAIWQGMTLQ